MIVVSNAGPLISLARIERFELLLEQVLDELKAKGFRIGDGIYSEALNSSQAF